MSKSFKLLVFISILAVVGCAPTQSQLLASKQGMAMQTAVSRAQFEMNCQQVSPVLISEEVVQPALQGPFANGINRAEYTAASALPSSLFARREGKGVLPQALAISTDIDGESPRRRLEGSTRNTTEKAQFNNADLAGSIVPLCS